VACSPIACSVSAPAQHHLSYASVHPHGAEISGEPKAALACNMTPPRSKGRAGQKVPRRTCNDDREGKNAVGRQYRPACRKLPAVASATSLGGASVSRTRAMAVANPEFSGRRGHE
jgi:hypothetical protein